MKFKRSQLKSIFLSIFFVLILSIFVYALGTNSVKLISPANASWTNLTTNTSLTFNWTDVNDVNINLADCKLYINTSLLGLISSENEFGRNESVVANLTTNIYMNKTFDNSNSTPVNNTVFYWTIQCSNASSSPATGSPSFPNYLYQDLIFPKVINISQSLHNNTWLNSDIRIEINVSDNGTTEGMFGDLITCEILNASRVIASGTTGETGINGTSFNVTNSSVADGLYSSLRYRCTDPAGNVNTSRDLYNITLDQTAPEFVSFDTPTPLEGNNQSGNTLIFNFTINELNLEVVLVEFGGSNRSVNLSSECNATAPLIGPIYCNVTNSSILDKRDHTLKLYINDSAGNKIVSSTRTFSVDTIAPIFASIDSVNFTTFRSIVNYSIEVNDTNAASCRVFITDRNGVVVFINNGSLSDIGENTANCTGQINATQIKVEGSFNLTYNVTDGVNRTNATSGSLGVLTRLFAGWNIITYPDGNKSLIEICEEIEECSRVSWFNNTAGAKSFKTFTNSTPGINNRTNISSGEALHVYVEANSWVISNDHLMTQESLESVWNYSLSVPGWNLVGLLKNASINTTLHVQGVNSTTVAAHVLGINTTYVSWRNASADLYYSCKRSLDKCSATSAVPKDINLPKGYGVWMLPKFNYTINRSTMEG